MGIPPRRLGIGVGALRAFSILVVVAALLCAARTFRRSVAIAAGPTRKALSPEFQAQLAAVTERLPAGASVLYLPTAHEEWYSRLWQRALIPRNETVILEPPWSAERLRELRARYAIRFALAAGSPPSDPGYLWSVDLGRIPGGPGATRFGELAP